MKKFKVIKFLLSMIFSLVVLCACGNKNTSTNTTTTDQHIHNYETTYYKDSNNHWKECSCGEKSNISEHVYGDWITITEATEESIGSKKQVCDTCGYENIIEIPKVEVISFEVTFVIDESNIVTKTYKVGSIIDFLPDQKQYHNFLGWSLSEESNEIVKDYQMPDKAITLYAKWEFAGSIGLNISDTTLLGIGTCTDKDIIIPSYITKIKDRAFQANTNIISITIPATVTSIGDWVFLGCSNLTSIIVDGNNTVYDSRENCNAIIETANNKLLFGCENTSIPNGVTSIANEAFCGCINLKTIKLPETITEINNLAFSECSNLESIIVPKS